MQITNKGNLPQVLVDAVANDPYDPGEKTDMSVTTLLQPARKVALTKEHGHELVEDAADRMWALMGSAIHVVLEQAGEAPNRIIERRFYGDFDGWKISGQVDVIEDDVMSDYKFMSVWEIIYGLKEEKIAQLNMLRLLARNEGVEVNSIQIVAMLRDWQMIKSKTDANYPQHHIMTVPVPVWDDKTVTEAILSRIQAHRDTEVGLPLCSDEERWYSGSKYAVMKTGRKSALRVLGSQEDAEKWMEDNSDKGGTNIEFRPGENKRCENYCSVCEKCEQFQSLKG